MACLREQTSKERGGALLCDEKGCKLRLFPIINDTWLNGEASKTYCILQLRLRTRIAEDFGETAGEVFERFNEQPWTWNPYLEEWKAYWRSANPGYPIRKGRSELIEAPNIEKFFADFDEPSEEEKRLRFGEWKQEQNIIERKDKYNITINGVTVRATEEQERTIRNFNQEQLNRFRKIMGD